MMKKLCILCILLPLLISSGCSSNDSSDISDSDLKKAQAIAVTNADGTILTTITDQDAIDDFVTALQLDDWHLSERPKNAQIIGSFGLSQEKTIHFNETDNDGKLYDIAQLHLYDTPIVDLDLLGFQLTFTIPDTAYETLINYLQKKTALQTNDSRLQRRFSIPNAHVFIKCLLLRHHIVVDFCHGFCHAMCITGLLIVQHPVVLTENMGFGCRACKT